MNRITLLELTEKELETLKAAIIKEKISWEDKTVEEASNSSIEDHMTTCNSIWAKIDAADRTQPTALVTEKDLYFIKSLAVDEYKRLPINTKVSNKEIEQKDLVHISLANAIFSWLNGKNLLKRLVKFDYTDDSNDYEGNDY